MKKFTTGFETVYLKRKDGLYQEVTRHFLHFTDADGRRVSKLDNEIRGKVFREALDGERGLHGEAEFTNESGVKVRLVAMMDDRRW